MKWLAGRRWPVLRLVLALAPLLCFTLVAQEEPSGNSPVQTLHLFANLARVPVLVLDRRLEPMPSIPYDLFSISVDGGRPFKPTRIQRQEDDAISLSILLDMSGGETRLIEQFAKNVPGWAAHSLHSNDRVSIYGMDCSLVRTGQDMPGSDPQRIARAVRAAIDFKTIHGGKNKAACWAHKPLWDSLDLLTAQMAGRPGWRVVLALTDGRDGASMRPWTEVRLRAAGMATALFGITAEDVSQRLVYDNATPFENKFNLLCRLTGGIQVFEDPRALDTELQVFVKMLRDRYIVEFPRPHGLYASEHLLEVKIRKRDPLIFSAGLSMTVETAEELAPENRSTDPIETPEVGNRRMVKPQW